MSILIIYFLVFCCSFSYTWYCTKSKNLMEKVLHWWTLNSFTGENLTIDYFREKGKLCRFRIIFLYLSILYTQNKIGFLSQFLLYMNILAKKIERYLFLMPQIAILILKLEVYPTKMIIELQKLTEEWKIFLIIDHKGTKMQSCSVRPC